MDPEDLDSDLSHSQNLITSSFYHFGHILNILSKSVLKFFSYLVHKQTKRRTDKPKRKHSFLGNGKYTKNKTSWYLVQWCSKYLYHCCIYLLSVSYQCIIRTCVFDLRLVNVYVTWSVSIWVIRSSNNYQNWQLWYIIAVYYKLYCFTEIMPILNISCVSHDGMFCLSF